MSTSAPSLPRVDDAWRLARRFATGVAVVTCGTGDEVRGGTVSSFCLVSRDPALVSVCLRRGSELLDLIGRHQRFTVNVLSGEQAGLARHFADPDRRAGPRQFDGVRWVPGEFGEPRLIGTLCWLHCRPCARMAAGDHELVLARVSSSAGDSGHNPLLYFAGALHEGAQLIEDVR